jgi:hypothetical protein
MVHPYSRLIEVYFEEIQEKLRDIRYLIEEIDPETKLSNLDDYTINTFENIIDELVSLEVYILREENDRIPEVSAEESKEYHERSF